MPIVRILLVLLALASPALAQDGAGDAAAAREAAQAFRVYVEGVTKTGGRPDLTRPEVAALLGRVFDLAALNALPPAQANDILWLLDWMDAANATNKLFTRYGSKPGPQPDLAAIQRNMTELRKHRLVARPLRHPAFASRAVPVFDLIGMESRGVRHGCSCFGKDDRVGTVYVSHMQDAIGTFATSGVGPFLAISGPSAWHHIS